MVDHLVKLVDRPEVVVDPSASPGRGARVVAEIESSTPGTSEMTRRHSVVLPAPDGLGNDEHDPAPRPHALSGWWRGHSTF